MWIRFAWVLTMLVGTAGLAPPQARAAGAACPRLAATRLAKLPPPVAHDVETRVRLSVWRPRVGDVADVVRMLHHADPNASPLAINNYLIAISCPVILSHMRSERAVDSAALHAFASKVQKALY